MNLFRSSKTLTTLALLPSLFSLIPRTGRTSVLPTACRCHALSYYLRTVNLDNAKSKHALNSGASMRYSQNYAGGGVKLKPIPFARALQPYPQVVRPCAANARATSGQPLA